VAEPPLVGVVNAERVVVAREVHGGIHAEQLTVLTLSSGKRIERVFASVPAQGPSLVGRSADFAELQTRVTTGGAHALHGLPGAGKSALALALAYDEATLERFSGGVLWAGLGLQPNVDGILNLWGMALGADVRGAGTTVERARRLNAHLQESSAGIAGRPFLVVLDDAWRWEDVVPFLSLTTPGYAVLLTTRDEALARRFSHRSGREALAVHELPDAAAIELLAQACPEARQADPDGLRELAQAVGGLPLALVLIGRELAANAGQARWVRKTVERLRSAKERLALTEDEPRPGLAGVPLSLRAVVELSLAALGEAATAFAQLGVFAPKPADFAREATLAVWQVQDDEGDDRLQSLAHHGLLEPTREDRFTLHQVLGAVARAHLTETPQPPAARDAAARHFAYYRALVDRDPDAWHGPDIPQYDQARRWAESTPGWEEQATELTLALLRPVLRLAFDEEWYASALEEARAKQQPAEEGRLLRGLGDMLLERNDFEAALGHYDRALTASRAAGDRDGEARTLRRVGEVCYRIGGLYRDGGDLEPALGYYQRALAAQREAGDRSGEARTWNDVGGVFAMVGEPEAALPNFEQAVAIRRQIGDRDGEARALGNMAKVLNDRAAALFFRVNEGAGKLMAEERDALLGRARADLEAALGYYQQALAAQRQAGDGAPEANALRQAIGTVQYNIGRIRLLQGDVEAALDCYDRALATQREAGDRGGEAITLKSIAELRD
jgi:tetratricopeptide (TPR) repeat protein